MASVPLVFHYLAITGIWDRILPRERSRAFALRALGAAPTARLAQVAVAHDRDEAVAAHTGRDTQCRKFPDRVLVERPVKRDTSAVGERDFPGRTLIAPEPHVAAPHQCFPGSVIL